MYTVLMNTKATPKVRKQFELTPAEDQALAHLIAAGYPFPAESEVGVIRKMLRDVWNLVFPDKPFPQEEEK